VLASPKSAVVLLATLAVVLTGATLLEARHGADYARWYVYESYWFVGLLALLGVHSLCAAASRFPWKWHHAGFVVTHAGFLILLTGALWSFCGGWEGRVSLAEGETTQQIVLAQRSQITAFWVGQPLEPPFEFTFDGGPVDWPQRKVLDIGEVDGVKARILAYYQHADPDESWVTDESHLGGPAVRIKASDESGALVAEGWLADQQFGDAVAVGPIRLQLQQAVTDRMLEDFLQPSVEKLGEKGLLVMYLGDAVERVPLDKYAGRKIPLGSSGVAVEIANYLPNAVPDRLGNFATKGDQPKNPMIELRVYLPGEEQPLRQVAFAKDPLLNLDGVYARVCPVKFRFHHPAVPPPDAAELMQTSDGKLFARLCSEGRYTSRGELRAGDVLDLPDHSRLEIVEHIPHARRKVTFTSDVSATSRNARENSEPAALVEITVGGKTEQAWLRRNDPVYGRSTLTMPGGILALSYEHGSVPLGFSLELVALHKEPNPGGVGKTALSSKVRIVESERGVDRIADISINHPLRREGFAVYQSDSDDAAHGRSRSSLLVVYDPGRTLKYFGSLMIGLGIAVAATRWFSSRLRRRTWRRNSRSSSLVVPRNHRSQTELRPAA